jgi:hypothetical protein
VANLLSLFDYNPSALQDFLPYVILQTQAPHRAHSLSPDIMQLDDSIFVIDLHIVESYWRQRAQITNTPTSSVNDFLQEVIRQTCPDSSLALFCQHPFQGLVFFNHLKNLQSQGVFRTDSLFAKKVYQNMGWHPWLFSARQMYDCFERVGCLKKERKHFSSQLRRLSRFIERVDLQEFSSLQQAHYYEISRRFQGFIGLLWKWTFAEPPIEPKSSNQSQLTFEHYEQLQGFPWIPYFVDDPPEQQQLLEYPVSQWESLRESLLYDLYKLSQHPKLQAPYKVLQIQWQITLFDMSQVTETLGLKYPLCLQQERANDFAILEQQLHFCFDQFQKQLHGRDQDWQWINTPLLVGWTLRVTKGIILAEKTHCLDLKEKLQQGRRDELVSLASKVKNGLQSFEVLETFVPGLDFSEKNLLQETDNLSDDLLSLLRPFYLLSEEQEVTTESIKKYQFLERTSSDWWTRQDPLDSYRDCFLCELNDKRLVFAYRNYKGRWFCYGD